MKRLTAALLILLLILTSVLSGCTKGEKDSTDKIHIICTIFPQYDWTRQILGDRAAGADLTLLLNNGADLHSYQPSVNDIVRISDCDLFIFVGGESDAWAADAVKQAANKNMVVINLLDILGGAAKTGEIIEGMEEGNEAGDESEYDEHVWLSLRNAQLFCTAIAEALSFLDADNAEEYRDNLAIYLEKLVALDLAYQNAINAAPVRTLLFGDRFPFRYLVDDYGLNYYAAFAGCSAETEASFETVLFLVGKADDLGIKNIMVTESSDKKMAETIIRESKNSNRQILVMDAMQSISSGDVANGITYLSVMESNLKVLKEALR